MFQPKFSCLRAARISRFFRVNCKLVACKTTFFFRICNLTVMIWTVTRNYKKGKRLTRGSHFIFARVWGMRLESPPPPPPPTPPSYVPGKAIVGRFLSWIGSDFWGMDLKGGISFRLSHPYKHTPIRNLWEYPPGRGPGRGLFPVKRFLWNGERFKIPLNFMRVNINLHF